MRASAVNASVRIPRRTAACYRVGLIGALLGFVLTGAAGAQVTTQQSASILFFPDVVADGAQDTVIQLTNLSNSVVGSRCFYIDASGSQLVTVAFTIQLTRQQPTQWVVSRGRADDPTDSLCSPANGACSGAGIDPGLIPPVSAGFRGALVCVEVDQSGAPLPGNHFVGVATLVSSGGSDVGKYSAIGVLGNFNNDGDNVLCLGGDVGPGCVFGGEYDGCPVEWLYNHSAAGAEDPILGAGSNVAPALAALPCTIDLLGNVLTSVPLNFQIITEFEQTFSASTTVVGRLDAALADISSTFGVAVLGSPVARTRITSPDPTGVAIVGREVRTEGGPSPASMSASSNLHRDNGQKVDVVSLPTP